ncbi:MAG: DUF2442 domain-containing protein [Fimbriimonadales bacterium]
MNSSEAHKMAALATDVAFTDHEMIVCLADGRSITVPLEWFPRLRDASPENRSKWRLIGDGIGISWEALDEDISVPALLAA